MRAGFSVVAHFAGKREIEVLLIAEGFERYAEAMEAAGPRLTDIAVAYRAFALEIPARYRLMTERPPPREDLPEGLEARAARSLLLAVGGDPDLARVSTPPTTLVPPPNGTTAMSCAAQVPSTSATSSRVAG